MEAISENQSGTQHRTYRLDPDTTGAYRLAGVCGTTDVNTVSFVPLDNIGFEMVVLGKDGTDIVELFRPSRK